MWCASGIRFGSSAFLHIHEWYSKELRDLINHSFCWLHKSVFSHKNLFSLKETMNRELSKIKSWLPANKLSLTIKKTHFISFKSRGKKSNQNLSITINNQEIEQVKYIKFLGLYIDDEFTWKYSIDQVASKRRKMTGIMANTRHYLSLKTLQTIYGTMVYPYLTYCNIVWTSTHP